MIFAGGSLLISGMTCVGLQLSVAFCGGVALLTSLAVCVEADSAQSATAAPISAALRVTLTVLLMGFDVLSIEHLHSEQSCAVCVAFRGCKRERENLCASAAIAPLDIGRDPYLG